MRTAQALAAFPPVSLWPTRVFRRLRRGQYEKAAVRGEAGTSYSPQRTQRCAEEKKVGLLINFNILHPKDGLKRRVLGL